MLEGALLRHKAVSLGHIPGADLTNQPFSNKPNSAQAGQWLSPTQKNPKKTISTQKRDCQP
jgi:hypothetical protein